MFVTEINNDVAQLGWRVKGAQSWERTGIMDFKRASAVEVWAGTDGAVAAQHQRAGYDFPEFRKLAAAQFRAQLAATRHAAARR